VRCADCAGGQLAGQPLDVARWQASELRAQTDAAATVAGAGTR
jgi:hypothetical protein